jgi:hypothetical protein
MCINMRFFHVKGSNENATFTPVSLFNCVKNNSKT